MMRLLSSRSFLRRSYECYCLTHQLPLNASSDGFAKRFELHYQQKKVVVDCFKKF
jgi:hypothetical protein